MRRADDKQGAFGPGNAWADGIPELNLAPHSEWTQIGDCDHFAQFYETEAFLMNSVSGFIGSALMAGNAGIVVTTEERRRGLATRLQAYGLDVPAAVASGQYIPLDASELLSRFMVGGKPDSRRFTDLLGGILSRATEGGRGVRVFGEMVALLTGEGNHAGAIRLEELWNDLLREHRFALLCAYPMKHFGNEGLVSSLREVCARHSRVIPAEGYTTIATAEDRLRAITVLQLQAKLLQAEIAERKLAEDSLRSMKEELEKQVEDLRCLHEMSNQLLVREQMARAEAETASRIKDEFLATVSHELRTPLNAIIGWSHMLRSGGLDADTAARAVETIDRNARSQAQLIEDILDVSRIITGKLRLNIGMVDAASVINAAIDSVQLAADSKDIHLEVTLDPSARHVAGDANRLQQVVWNLLSNAIKFTPTGGQIDIGLERSGKNAEIRVADNGQGIKAGFLPFIFDRFRQEDSTSTRRHGGLGLGLAIVRHLVELHGGSVAVSSPGEGCGATFTITLPIASAQERAQVRRTSTGSLLPVQDLNARLEPLPSINGVKALLVDDDPDTVQMLTLVLNANGAEVHGVRSGAEALEALDWYRPDVLLFDLALPGEDGFTLIGKVREREGEKGKKTPAVALTAYARVEDRARALSAGFNMFVPKPIEPSELITTIANLTSTDLNGLKLS